MMKFLRSQSQTVLLVLLAVLFGSFLFYGNVGTSMLSGQAVKGNDFGRIDGQDLSVADLYNAVRDTRTSLLLNGQTQASRSDVAEEAWRELLLQREADRLHIEISDQELVDHVRGMEVFQKDGAYSPQLYQTFMTALNDRLHISSDAFEALVRNQMRVEAVRQALFSGVRASTRDLSSEYEKYYGPMQVSVVTIDPKSVMSNVHVTPAEIQSEYKAHPENPAYRTAEKRQVDYVIWSLPPDQAKLPQKDKDTAIEALGEKALDFALALQPSPAAGSSVPPPSPDFSAEAEKRGLTPVTSDFFAADTPPSGLPPSPAFNNAAFALTKDDPISKVVELSDGVAVLHLNQIQPSELRPLNEVQGVIQAQLQQQDAVQMEKFVAQMDAQSLQAKVSKGVDFQKAAVAQKLAVKTLPVFVPTEVPQGDARLQEIAYAALNLPTNSVSQPLPIESDNSILILHVDTRAPANLDGLPAFEKMFTEKQDEQLRDLVYVDWASWMGRQPGTHPPPNLDDYGGLE